jgi:hypothetical protein
MQGRISWATLCALFPAAVFVAAIWTTIDFPLGTLGDEWAKIDGVRTGNNRYYHPLLIIEVTQFAICSPARAIDRPLSSGRAARRSPAVASCFYWLAPLGCQLKPCSNICDGAMPIARVHARIMKDIAVPFLIMGSLSRLRQS